VSNGVFSTRIWSGTLNAISTLTTVATVPAAHRIVLREIFLNCAPASGVALLIYLGPANHMVSRVDAPSGDAGRRIDSRLVFHELEQIQLRMLVAAGNIALSGYLLTGAGGPVAAGASELTPPDASLIVGTLPRGAPPVGG
jgi:hypothetical protein